MSRALPDEPLAWTKAIPSLAVALGAALCLTWFDALATFARKELADGHLCCECGWIDIALSGSWFLRHYAGGLAGAFLVLIAGQASGILPPRSFAFRVVKAAVVLSWLLLFLCLRAAGQLASE